MDMDGSNDAAARGAAAPSAAMEHAVTTSTTTTSKREAEIDEIMEFFRFSVKESTGFQGAIRFCFRQGPRDEDATTYLVHVDDKKRVTTRKNSADKDAQVLCEVSMSIDDFLWVYSGKASAADMAKMFYAGRVSVSGFAFRKVTQFARSFDYSSSKWREFYEQRSKHGQADAARQMENENAREVAHRMGAPNGEYWILQSRAILKRFHLSRVQCILWEAAVARIFGEPFAIKILKKEVACCRSVSRANGHGKAQHVANSQHARKDHDERELLFFLAPSKEHQGRDMQELLTAMSAHPTKCAAYVAMDSRYVNAVAATVRRRWQDYDRQDKNRMDLADAGMDQLDRILIALGKRGHRNEKRKTPAKYVPAPELLLQEFSTHATKAVNIFMEKTLKRLSSDHVPPPDASWFLRLDSTSAPIGATSQQRGRPKSIAAALRPRSAFDLASKTMNTKNTPSSNEIVPQQPGRRSITLDEHMIFTDFM